MVGPVNVRLLFYVMLLGFVPASSFGASPKSNPAPVVKPVAAKAKKPSPSAHQVTRAPAKPVAVSVKKAIPAAKPVPIAKKPSFSVKALFSRKPAPPATVKVTPAATTPAKRTVSVKPKPAKPIPVIVRNSSEFVNISFPAPQKEKSPVVAEGGSRAR